MKPEIRRAVRGLVVIVLIGGWLVCNLHADGSLQNFTGCRLETAEWADGDSFPVKFPDGTVRTVRLYGVDCLETHTVGDVTNARRLRDQQRWFGIPEIEIARVVGKTATEATRSLLDSPFTVHTAFADGRGSSAYSRIYAFITTADGSDLSEELVRRGWARAFGVARQRPDGTSGNDWKAFLNDLELLAARRGAGAWSHTDWNRILSDRRELRVEAAELEAVIRPAARLNPGATIDLNTAARDELMALPGIGEVLALRIIENRPYTAVEELLNVPGIGSKTLTSIEGYLVIRR